MHMRILVQLTFLNPTDFWWLGQGLTYTIKIYKTGYDPGVSINILYKPPRKAPMVLYREERCPVVAPTPVKVPTKSTPS